MADRAGCQLLQRLQEGLEAPPVTLRGKKLACGALAKLQEANLTTDCEHRRDQSVSRQFYVSIFCTSLSFSPYGPWMMFARCKPTCAAKNTVANDQETAQRQPLLYSWSSFP